MSTYSVNSDADSEASTVYHSCRSGREGHSAARSTTTDDGETSFRSAFSSRSISTLNSYQSALSYLSSGTSATGGYVTANSEVSSICSDDDARTLQGDEFGPCVDDDDDDLGNEFALDEDRLVKQVASSSGSNQPQYGSAGLSGHGSSARDLREESVTPVPQSPQENGSLVAAAASSIGRVDQLLAGRVDSGGCGRGREEEVGDVEEDEEEDDTPRGSAANLIAVIEEDQQSQPPQNKTSQNLNKKNSQVARPSVPPPDAPRLPATNSTPAYRIPSAVGSLGNGSRTPDPELPESAAGGEVATCQDDSDPSSSSSSTHYFPSPAHGNFRTPNCMEKSIVSTVTQIEVPITIHGKQQEHNGCPPPLHPPPWHPDDFSETTTAPPISTSSTSPHEEGDSMMTSPDQPNPGLVSDRSLSPVPPFAAAHTNLQESRKSNNNKRGLGSGGGGGDADLCHQHGPPVVLPTPGTPPMPRHIFPELPTSPDDEVGGRVNGGGRTVSFARPDSSQGSNSSQNRCNCWLVSQGTLLVPLVICLAVSIQVVMRSGMSADYSWWKVVVIRGTFQVLTAGLVLILKAVINATNARRQTDGPHGGAGAGPLRGHEGSEDGSGRQRRRRLMLVTRCTFSLRSHRTAYFSQALLSFVYVASAVETVERVPPSTLATVFHLMPIILIAVDNARARKTPNFMCYISTALLIAGCFMLSWPPSCMPDDEPCHYDWRRNRIGDNNDSSGPSSNPKWFPPLFNADLIYGWPLDPRHFDPHSDQASRGSSWLVMTQIVLVILSLACPLLSVILLANRETIDTSKVVLSQGVGALIYCLVDTRKWVSLRYEDASSIWSAIAVSIFGTVVSYLLVWLLTRREDQTLRSASAHANSDGDEDDVEQLNRSVLSRGVTMGHPHTGGFTLSTVTHMPTLLTLIITSQLLATSIINFATYSEPFCCSAKDILGLVAISCLLGIVTVVGLQPQRTLSDLRFPFQTKSGQDDQAQTPTNVIVTFDDRVAH